MGGSITYPIAFLAGISSFVSPCILPLIPFYLAFMAGDSTMHDTKTRIGRCYLFVAGFSLIFILLGASFGLAGSLINSSMELWSKIAGSIIIVLGLTYMGALRIPFLMRERRIHLKPGSKTTLRAFLLGAAFGFGWTPCVGPILASILFLASQTTTLINGMALLAVYSLGLGIPFIVMAYGYEKMSRLTDWLRQHAKTVSLLSGGFLIAIGIFVFFGTLRNFTGWVLSLGLRFSSLPETKKMLIDTLTSSFFVTAGIGTVIYDSIRRHNRGKKISLGGIIFGLILVIVGIAGFSGIVTPSGFFGIWLSWQGI